MSKILGKNDTGYEYIYILIALKSLNINRCTISDVCNNRKNTVGRYKWRYL